MHLNYGFIANANIFSRVNRHVFVDVCEGLIHFGACKPEHSLSPHAAALFSALLISFRGIQTRLNVNRYKIVIQIHAFVSLLCHGCAVKIGKEAFLPTSVCCGLFLVIDKK